MNFKKSLLVSCVLVVCHTQITMADTTKEEKTSWSNGTRKENIKHYYDETGRLYQNVIEMFDNNGRYIKTKTVYFDKDNMNYFLEKYKKTDLEKKNDIYNLHVFNKDYKIERKITDDIGDVGVGCDIHNNNEKLLNDDTDKVKRRIAIEKGKSSNSWTDMFEFLDDYACIHGVTSDKDNFDKRKTYRYRINGSVDLKMQKWTPAIEFFFDDKKKNSLEIIPWDRKTGIDDGGGPLINFKRRF